MKLPNYRRLMKTDFPNEFQDLVERLAYVININTQSVYDALNRKVSLGDNIDCVIRNIEITVDGSGIPVNTAIFGVDDKVRVVQGLEVQRAENLTNSNVYPTGGIFLTFQQVQTGVQIQHVTGLPAGYNFRLRVVGYY